MYESFQTYTLSSSSNEVRDKKAKKAGLYIRSKGKTVHSICVFDEFVI